MGMVAKIARSVADGTFSGKVRAKLVRRLCAGNAGVDVLLRKAAESARLRKDYAGVLEKAAATVQPPGEFSRTTWTCWQQGLDNAPPLVRACIASQRCNMPGRELVVVTDKNIGDYVDLPRTIMEKRKAGLISPAHYSDIVRCALLCRHGGMWCDATVLCTAPEFPAFAAELPLFAFKEFDLARTGDAPILASSWFLAARAHHPVLETVLALLYAYWEREDRLRHYFLFHLFFAMAARRFPEEWARVPCFDNHGPHTLMFELGEPFSPGRWKWILRASDIHKLNRHLSFDGTDGTFYHHVLREFLAEPPGGGDAP